MKQKRLRELFIYDENSGILIRRKRIQGSGNALSIVGTIDKDGYLTCKVDGKTKKIHRIAWVYMFGKEPGEIDHINQVKTDNRICNLRIVSHSDNMKNMSKSKRNTSGIIGVSWDKNIKKWKANICVNSKQLYLGSFESFSDAVDARKNAEILYGYHKNHGKEKLC